MGKSGDRRAGLGDAAGPGLFPGGTDLPGFSGKLCQWPVGKLAAGRGLPVQSGPMGNPHLEALETELKGAPVAKMPRTPQMNLRLGRKTRSLKSAFPEGDVTDARPL